MLIDDTNRPLFGNTKKKREIPFYLLRRPGLGWAWAGHNADKARRKSRSDESGSCRKNVLEPKLLDGEMSREEKCSTGKCPRDNVAQGKRSDTIWCNVVDAKTTLSSGGHTRGFDSKTVYR